MNYSKYVLFFGIVLTACTQEKLSEFEIAEKHANGTVKTSQLTFGGKEDSTFFVKEFYKTGVVKSTFCYVNGKVNGKAIGYFPNGMPATYKEFAMGIENGWFLTFYESGIIRSKFFKRHGITEKGNYYFDNGQPTGCLLFDEKGQIVEGEYYYPNGNYRSAGKFHEQMKKGPWREYYENGSIKAAGIYNVGLKKEGWVYYDSLGVVMESSDVQK